MTLARYAAILVVTVVAGSAATIAARVAGHGGQAFWSFVSSQTSKPPVLDVAPSGASPKAVAPQDGDDPRPILPHEFAAIPGERLTLYYDGLITARDPDKFTVEISAPTLRGRTERRYWTFEPTLADVGRHAMTVTVKSLSDGTQLAQATTSVVVADPAKFPGLFNVLMVGASNTHQAILPNALWTRLDKWNSGKFAFVGSEPLKGDFPFYRTPLKQIRHEGLGGWAWQTFASHYMPGNEALFKLPRSPFVFLENGKPTLNVARYLDEKGLRGKLGAVVFDLGINETFAADPDDPKNVDAIVSTALEWADKLVADFRAAAPEARIVIGIPAPFTRSDPVFAARYAKIKAEFGDAWRHRRIVLALARRMIAHFDQKDPLVVLAPLYPMVDVVDGYWQIDPGHPNELGADQMAAAFQAALLKALDPRKH